MVIFLLLLNTKESLTLGNSNCRRPVSLFRFLMFALADEKVTRACHAPTSALCEIRHQLSHSGQLSGSWHDWCVGGTCSSFVTHCFMLRRDEEETRERAREKFRL